MVSSKGSMIDSQPIPPATAGDPTLGCHRAGLQPLGWSQVTSAVDSSALRFLSHHSHQGTKLCWYRGWTPCSWSGSDLAWLTINWHVALGACKENSHEWSPPSEAAGGDATGF